MKTSEVISYMEENFKDFEYEILEGVSMSEKDIFLETKRSEIFHLLKSFDGFISHVKQSDDTVYVGSTDRSRNSTDFNFHTDGLYYKSVPEIIALYCVNPGSGNNTSFISNTNNAIGRLLEKDKDILKQLQYTYVGRDGKHHVRELLETDPLTGKLITNISAKGFVSPHSYLGVNMPDLFEASVAVSNLYENLKKEIVLRHKRKEGDLLLLNNNLYAHGREGNEKDYERHLLRVWFGVDRTWLE